MAWEKIMAAMTHCHFWFWIFSNPMANQLIKSTNITIRIWANSTPKANSKRPKMTSPSVAIILKYRPKPKPWINPKNKVIMLIQTPLRWVGVFWTSVERQVIQMVTGIKNSTHLASIFTHSKWVINSDNESPKVKRLTHNSSFRQFLNANGSERATRK